MRLTLTDFEMLEPREEVHQLGLLIGVDKLVERTRGVEPRLPAPTSAEEG